MRKIVFTTFLVFGLFVFTENIFGQVYYKSVDEKGTIQFSDDPTSSVGNQEKGIEDTDQHRTDHRYNGLFFVIRHIFFLV